jgi:tetratricopeptide (TPR) repeat protein
MRRLGWALGLTLAAGACTPAVPERLREYAEDGIHLYHQGAYPQARQSFEAALALAPNDVNLMFNVAQCHDQLGQHEPAEKLYRDCLARAPDHAECRHALNVLLYARGRRPDVVANVDDWFRRSPKQAGPYAELGWLHQKDGDLLKARTAFQEALAIDPRNNVALVELARHYEGLGLPDRAVVLYERALQANPNQPAVKQRLSLLRSRGATRPRPD